VGVEIQLHAYLMYAIDEDVCDQFHAYVILLLGGKKTLLPFAPETGWASEIIGCCREHKKSDPNAN